MEFIRTYFNVKFGAEERLFDYVKTAWDERRWLAVAGNVLGIMICNILSVLWLPIDFIFSVIKWNSDPEYRDFMGMLENAMTQEQE